MSRFLPVLPVVLLIFTLNCCAYQDTRLPNQPPADSLATQLLLRQIEAFQAGPAARFGTVALSVRRVRDGQELIGYNAHLSLPSASTLKLITTATALSVLGVNYTYPTVLEYDGALKDSTLTGNLYIRGTGDPSLGSWRFAAADDLPALLKTWSAAVRKAGIRRIQGAIVGDASLYDDLTTPGTWPYGDFGQLLRSQSECAQYQRKPVPGVFQTRQIGGRVGPGAAYRSGAALPDVPQHRYDRRGRHGRPGKYLRGTVSESAVANGQSADGCAGWRVQRERCAARPGLFLRPTPFRKF